MALKAPCCSCRRDMPVKYGVRYMLSTGAAVFWCALCRRDPGWVTCGHCGLIMPKPRTEPDMSYVSPVEREGVEVIHIVYCSEACKIQNRKRAKEEGTALVTATRCSGCNQSGRRYKACGGCNSVWYCSRDCQRAHWPTHKRECQAS